MPELISHNTHEYSQEETSEIIGNPPGWLLHTGITILALVFSTVIIAAYFIKYPDKIISSGILTAKNPPIEIIGRANGYIESIEKTNGSKVKQGEILINLQNTTNVTHLGGFKKWIEQCESITNPVKYLALKFPTNLNLGAMQPAYAKLQLTYNEMCHTLKDNLVFEQMTNIDREINNIKTLNESLQKEKAIFAKEIEITKKNHERNKMLKLSNVISELDLEKSQTALLQKERTYEGMTNATIQNIIRIEQLSLEKLKHKESRFNSIKSFQFNISETISKIKSEFKKWSNTYNISASLDGTIEYGTNIIDKKSVINGQILGHIVPDSSDSKYVSAVYPITNIGKIKLSHEAIIKFEAFPYKEFGSVRAKVGVISKMPEIGPDNQPKYEIIIPLPDEIKTDYDIVIPYKPNMTATIEIITDDRSILERIFEKFISLI